MDYTFECGCRFPVVGNDVEAQKDINAGKLPRINLDINTIRLDCPAVWKMLADGKTQGVFQLESPLGRQWTKKLRPNTLEHLSALSAILRPGCLRAMDENNISMTEHYCRRKNKEEDVTIYHPCLELVLSPTYGVLTYQEQSMKIAQIVAGFNLQEADTLRKAIGKKLPEEMAKCKKMFVDGASNVMIVSLEQSNELFNWIEKSQKYSFNHSHSACYGRIGYWSAYCKVHFPIQFFTSWLAYAKEKQDPKAEVRLLVNEAKLFDVDVQVPDIRDCQPYFYTDGSKINFGIANIKRIGEAQIKKIREIITEAEVSLKKNFSSFSWYEVLLHVSRKLGSVAMENGIAVGAFHAYQSNRALALAEYRAVAELTDKEMDFALTLKTDNVIDMLKAVAPVKARKKKELFSEPYGGTNSVRRSEAVLGLAKLLEFPPAQLTNSPNVIAGDEERLLGIPITFAAIDSCDVSEVNCTCKEFLAGRKGTVVLGVKVDSIRVVKTKTGKTPGKKMAFLTISDGSCAISDVCLFPDKYSELSPLLYEDATVIIVGERDTKRNSLIIKRASAASLNFNQSEDEVL